MIAAALLACEPYAAWPDPEAVFPYVVSEVQDLPPYARVRVETETWTPLEDLEETALYLQKAAYLLPDAPLETLLHFGEHRGRIPPLVPGDPVATFTGDLMMLDGEPVAVAEAVADHLRGLRVTNLETPVAPSFPTSRDALSPTWGLYAFNESTSLLDDLPVDVVQLTNNHTNDLGPDGIRETVDEVAARGFLGVGVDGDTLHLQHGGQDFAFLAYTWGLNRYEPAPEAELGIVPFGHLDADLDLSRVERDLRAARAAGATQLVVLVHWGYEYELYPDPHFLILGRRLVAAGADLVVGTGPHVVQPAEWCHVNQPAIAPGLGTCSVRSADGRRRDAAILYSLGDFATDLQLPELAVGILATASFSPAGGVSGLAWAPVLSDHDGAVTRTVPLSSRLDDEEWAAEAARLRAHLGPGWAAD
jgi:hypothetical protein